MGVSVLLVDDHCMMREGLRLLLERVPIVSKVHESDNGRAAVELVNELRPNIVVMDVALPELNGIDATRKIKANNPAVQVIGLSMFADKRYILGMLDAGASGYVLKGAAASELVQAIDAVSKGNKYLSPEIANLVVDGYLNRQEPIDHVASKVLGPREREVLQLLAEGNSSKEISQKLNISSMTVETHRRNIMKKLQLHSVAELRNGAEITSRNGV